MLFGILAVSILLCQVSFALDNGLALTPPMGWLSWERFRCNVDCKNDPEHCVSEQLYMRMADLIVSEGYRDAGYEYVNIDDCWAAMERDSQGRLQADPERFPHGMKALAKYIHSKGLKLGIYADFGAATCQGYPGSEFYMEKDANTFAEWEVDSLKFDGCHSNLKDMPIGYPIMGKFLNATGRPILYNCQWPGYLIVSGMKPDYEAVRATCNQWRNYKDVQDSWDTVLDVITHYGEDLDNSSAYAGPGGWNDPDELAVGDFGLSYYQQKAQFGMWAMFAAPLLMSTDLRTIPEESKALLLNRNIIAIDQDPLGNQAVRVQNQELFSVWVKKLAKSGSRAIAILNVSIKGRPLPFSSSFAALGFTNENGYAVREAFENQPIGHYSLTEEFTIMVDPTSVYIMIADAL